MLNVVCMSLFRRVHMSIEQIRERTRYMSKSKVNYMPVCVRQLWFFFHIRSSLISLLLLSIFALFLKAHVVFFFSLLSFVWHNPRLKYACVVCARFAIYRVYRVSVILIFSMFCFFVWRCAWWHLYCPFHFIESYYYWQHNFFFTSCDFTANKTAGGGATTAMMIAMIVLLNGRSCVSLTA